MKKTKMLFMMLMIMVIMLFSSKCQASWADLTDEEADAEAKEQQVQQEKEQEENKGKSNNNYLSELYIKDYNITPEFDRQTVNYEVKEEITETSIEIIAKADDENAKISGIGTVNIQSGENNIRIDVVAENGAVRTYYIKITKLSETQDENKEETENIVTNNLIEKLETETETDKRYIETKPLIIKKKYKKFILFGIAFFIVAALMIFILLKKNKKKSKH